MTKRRWIRLLLAGFALAAPVESRAIVGSARDGAEFADRVVTILTRGPEGSGFCTGVVLGSRVLLTAAHCLRKPSDMLVLYRDGAGAPILVPVAESAKHPDYREDAVRLRLVSIDLGLVETTSPLPDRFRAAELADTAPAVGDPAIVVGFGLAAEGEPRTGGALRAADLRVGEPLSHILLWVEDPERSGVGACSGDSGGPIFAADRRTVLAVVAWTKGEKTRKCGVVTQGPLTAPARDWITSVRARWAR